MNEEKYDWIERPEKHLRRKQISYYVFPIKEDYSLS